jgi:CheY-like chemotaxis protein
MSSVAFPWWLWSAGTDILIGTHGSSMWLIAVTGYGQAEDRQRSRDAGFDAHLVKPVAVEQLRESLMKTSEGPVLR